MADVELVIKISEETYDIVQNKLDFNGDLDKQGVKALMLAIDNGTPLNEALNKIRTEIDNINLNEVAAKYEDRFYGFQQEVIKILDKYNG